MRISFICGAYRPNKCGISDYVNLLSTSLQNLGHEVNYHEILNRSEKGTIIEELNLAEKCSMQFAPYAFSRSGICGKKLNTLAKVLYSKKLHINFHEIWIGAYPDATWKERLKGWRQKKEILKFLDKVNPNMITCSNSAAMDRLMQAGIKAKYLYLFGNIPYFQNLESFNHSNIRVGIFGTLYEKFPYNLLAEKLSALSVLVRKSVELRVIGRQREKTGLKQILKISDKFKFSFSETGELSTQSISMELQNCDVGLCTTPFDILGKSGTTAAMLEHRLPIIAFDDGDTEQEKLFVLEEFSGQVFLLNDKEFAPQILAFMQEKKKIFFDGVAHTTGEMLRILI